MAGAACLLAFPRLAWTEEAEPPPAATAGAPRVEAEAPISAVPGPQVLQALRWLLSSDPKEEARGAQVLRRMGASAAPQLRGWLKRVYAEAERVKSVLAGLGGPPDVKCPEEVSAHELLYQKLLECRALLKAGEYLKAAELADAIVLIDKHHPQAWELRRLSRRAHERLVARDALEPRVDVEKLVFELGDRPEFTFHLVNHNASEARIRLDRGVVGDFGMTVTTQSVSGAMRMEQTKLRIQVPADVEEIVIGPGRTWEHKLRYEPAELPVLSGVVMRFKVEGRFRPSEWAVKGFESNQGLSTDEVELWMVPAGQSELCERPLEKLTTALLFGKLEPLFVGGQLAVWAGEEDPYLNEKVIETILSSLEELDAARLQVASRLLQQATGQEFGPHPSRWQAWWAKAHGEK